MISYDKTGNVLKIVNLILLFVILGLIALIIFRLLTHPMLSDSNTLTFNDIDKMSDEDLQNYRLMICKNYKEL